MRHSLVIVCWVLVTSTLAVKTSLEDIERDNLRSEKRTIQPKLASPSPTDFGFVPVKTIQDYARQQPKQNYVQPQYIPAQHYTPPPTLQQQYAPPAQQYEQYSTLPQQYYYQQQQQQPQAQYQQYENVQYITDNSIAQPQQYYQAQQYQPQQYQQAAQQYYQPQQNQQQQYVYLQQQQYTAPSTSIQTIVDPKGGLQYVMYIPTYVPRAEQSQNYEDVIYADPKGAQPNYQEVQYQTPQVTPGIKYASEAQQEQPREPHKLAQLSILTQQAPPSAAQPSTFSENREPKSLLDSYVPSYLQVQYYKQQQQAQANAVQHQQTLKLNQPITGKVEYVKRPAQQQQRNAASAVKYNFQVPSAFHQ